MDGPAGYFSSKNPHGWTDVTGWTWAILYGPAVKGEDITNIIHVYSTETRTITNRRSPYTCMLKLTQYSNQP